MTTAWYPDYPAEWDWTDVTDFVDYVEAAHINQLYAEVNAIGTDLGSHKLDSTPHQDANGTHTWGFRVNVNKSVTMLFEEV